jgi:hypothetical protein
LHDDRAAAEVHGTSAALRSVASDVRAGGETHAQEVGEQQARIHLHADGLAVDGQ